MRAKGEGSVYYDQAADRWRGLIDLGKDGTGKRRRVKVTGRTRKEAAEKLKAKQAEVDAGHLTASTMTVTQLVDQWLEKVTPSMSPRNADFARWTAGHATAQLGAYRLTELRVDHVEDALTRLAADGLNKTSVGRVRSTLRRILHWAQGRDLVGKNVAEFAELPEAKPPRPSRALTAEEVAKLLEAVEGDRIAPLFQVMLRLGLRPAEALGLTWSAIDLDEGVLHVRQALKRRHGQPVLGDTKTPRSRRSLALDAPLVAILRQQRRTSREERLALRWPSEWDDLVFRSENGTPIDHANMRRTLNRAAKDAKIGHVRPYDFRHTFATMLADDGVRLEVIADLLGHEGLQLARSVYIEPRSGAARAPMEIISKILDAS